MPKSQVKKTRMFRDFSKMPSRFIKNNYLKNLNLNQPQQLRVISARMSVGAEVEHIDIILTNLMTSY